MRIVVDTNVIASAIFFRGKLTSFFIISWRVAWMLWPARRLWTSMKRLYSV